jgi:three-Cys-motif partner protein
LVGIEVGTVSGLIQRERPMSNLRLDEVGYWSEVKLDIVREYATAYSVIMNKQACIRRHLYIDGFAGPGVHISRETREFIPGSPLNALNIDPPFKEFHFIDLDGGRAQSLRELAGGRKDVFVHEADCNRVLLESVFPLAKYEDYRRALCLLDPYGLHLDWQVISTAGQMRSIEVFLNFPLMDMNMNVFWKNPDKVRADQVARMNAFWGDHSWRDVAYTRTPGLFGDMEEKADSDVIAEAFRERLRKVAGFTYVSPAMPMRNTTGAVVYYLFFASPNETGAKIVKDIFKKYGGRGLNRGP